MDLWRILVLAVPEQGLDCDFDRPAHLANHDGLVRRMPGRSTAVDNVSLSGPKLLSGIGQLVVESGRKAAGKKPGEPLRGRAGSFCVETDVHYPTDVNLLWDAMRCAVRTSRQRRKSPERVEEQLSLSAGLAGHRLLGGEKIPQGEKVFSIFEPHTRWIAEGKAGITQELGVPVCVVEDQRRFILHHRIMWRGGDIDHAAALSVLGSAGCCGIGSASTSPAARASAPPSIPEADFRATIRAVGGARLSAIRSNVVYTTFSNAIGTCRSGSCGSVRVQYT